MKNPFGWLKPKSLAEKYGFRKDEQLTIDQALNIAHKEADRSEDSLRKEAETIEYTPSVMTYEARKKYLDYCLSLCKGNERFVAILKIKIGMLTVPAFSDLTDAEKNVAISRKLREYGIHVSPMDVIKLEKDAIKFVQDQISIVKDSHIPILGGV